MEIVMNILLFGVSNVGKTTTGQILARLLGFDFHDTDEEVKSRFGVSLEQFVSMGTLRMRDKIRCHIIRLLLSAKTDQVIAVTPLSYMDEIVPLLKRPGVFPVELTDSVENIFNRLVFSDENDVIYWDDAYKNAHADYYLSEIQKDLDWYGSVYAGIEYHFDISGRTPDETAHALIEALHLERDISPAISHFIPK